MLDLTVGFNRIDKSFVMFETEYSTKISTSRTLYVSKVLNKIPAKETDKLDDWDNGRDINFTVRPAEESRCVDE